MKIHLHPGLTGCVRGVWAVLEGLHHEEHPAFREHLSSVCDEFARRYKGLVPSEIEQLAPARELYHSVGMDPTRLRPSSEALLRRVIKGKGLYRLDPVVDTGNLFSMSSGMPLGLYDLAFIEGEITLRMGVDGDGFEGIRKGRVNVEGRLCLADDRGPFGSPTSDSQRCAIRETTSTILFLLYAPASADKSRLSKERENLIESFSRWNGGRLSESGELGP